MPLSGGYYYPQINNDVYLSSFGDGTFILQNSIVLALSGTGRLFNSGSGDDESVFYMRSNGDIIDLYTAEEAVDISIIDELIIDGVVTSSTDANAVQFSSSITFHNDSPNFHLDSLNSSLILSSSHNSTITISGNLDMNNNDINNIGSVQIDSLSVSSVVLAFRTETGDYKLTDADYAVEVQAWSNPVEIMLPTATHSVGREYRIILNSSGSNNLTVAATGSETINGSNSLTIQDRYVALSLVSNGSNWLIT
jgi:hypothetical protein